MTKLVIVADASPLIALAKLEKLALLHELFSDLHVPEAVLLEVTVAQSRTDARLLKSYIAEHFTVHPTLDNPFTQEIRRILDDGEIQALALARQLGCGVLIDELRGRKVAHRYDIKTLGVLGLLMQGKQQGLVSEIAPLIAKLQAENYRLSTRLIESVLERMGEENHSITLGTK